MNKLIYTTRKGIIVELDEMDMHAIHKHYEIQSTADYLRDNHKDWPEDKVQKIATRVRELMSDYDYTETDAIYEVLKDWED